MAMPCVFCAKAIKPKRLAKPWPENQYCTKKCQTAHAEATAGESIWDILFKAGVAIGAKLHDEWQKRQAAGLPPEFRTAPPDMRSVCLEKLGLAPDASLEQAEKQYRSLARQHHPDKPGGCPDKMRDLNLAIQKLREIDHAA
jgi:DnaJ-domain-containing protein 1